MRITILCVGKIKESFYRDAVSEYAKRLSRYCRLEIVEVADEKTPDKASAALEEQIRERELRGEECSRPWLMLSRSEDRPDGFCYSLELAEEMAVLLNRLGRSNVKSLLAAAFSCVTLWYPLSSSLCAASSPARVSSPSCCAARSAAVSVICCVLFQISYACSQRDFAPVRLA